MGWGCQGDLACSQGRRWSLSAYMGGKGGRKGRATHQVVSLGWSSLDCLCQKKKGKERKNINWPVKNKREKRENFIFPWMSLSLFSLPPVIFPLFSLPLCFTYILNLSHSLSFLFFSLSHHPLPICLTQTCFPRPAIHRYRIHQQ